LPKIIPKSLSEIIATEKLVAKKVMLKPMPAIRI
jgi:hypothetical protein